MLNENFQKSKILSPIWWILPNFNVPLNWKKAENLKNQCLDQIPGVILHMKQLNLWLSCPSPLTIEFLTLCTVWANFERNLSILKFSDFLVTARGNFERPTSTLLVISNLKLSSQILSSVDRCSKNSISDSRALVALRKKFWATTWVHKIWFWVQAYFLFQIRLPKINENKSTSISMWSLWTKK